MTQDSSAPATFVITTGSGDTYWRAEAPAKVLGAKILSVPEEQADEAFAAPNSTTAFPWFMHAISVAGKGSKITSAKGFKRWQTLNAGEHFRTLVATFPAAEGTVIFQRPCMARAILGQQMRQAGIRTVAETDDNYFTAGRHSFFLREQHKTDDADELYEIHARGMASMGVMVTSTKWLASRYEREFEKRFGKKAMPEMHVCRNHVPDTDWPTIHGRYDGPVRVGFMGSPSHVWDVHVSYAAFHAAKELGATTTMIGYNPANPDPDVPEQIDVDGELRYTRNEESRRVSAQWAKVIDTHVRWRAPDVYHREALPLDIGLAPLVKANDFTRGKSDVKAVEYAIAGAVPVLMNQPIYTSAGWRHGVNCLLANDQEDMGLQVVKLLRDPKMRLELRDAAVQYVREQRGSKQIREEWRPVIQGRMAA